MTILSKWHDITNPGDPYPTYTHDSWKIPEEGTEVWCTGWKRGQTIKPYCDGCHVVVGLTVYHCDEFMGILDRWADDGHTWGIEGVTMIREQRINGCWRHIAS